MKFDKVEGIEDQKIISGPGNSLEKFIFNNLISMKSRLTDSLEVFEQLYKKIYKEEVIIKYINSILHSFEKLDVINDDEINFKIKEKQQVVPEIVGAAEFYKSQENNPDYPELESTKNLKLILQTLTSEDNTFKPGTGSIGNIMVSIYPSMSLVGNPPELHKLKELQKANKKDVFVGNQFDASREYNALYKQLDILITKEGAKQLIQEIGHFTQNISTFGDFYPGSGTTTTDLKRTYRDLGETLYKLDFYIMTEIKNNEAKKARYKKEGQKVYNEEIDKFKEKLKEDIKKEEEFQESKRNRGYYNPNPQT